MLAGLPASACTPDSAIKSVERGPACRQSRSHMCRAADVVTADIISQQRQAVKHSATLLDSDLFFALKRSCQRRSMAVTLSEALCDIHESPKTLRTAVKHSPALPFYNACAVRTAVQHAQEAY